MRSAIAGLCVESPDQPDTAATPDEEATGGPYLTDEITRSLDPFLTEFDTSNFRLSDRDLDRILKLLIVISSLAGGTK